MTDTQARYEALLKTRPWYINLRDRVWWRFSHLWCFLFGGVSQAEKFLLRLLAAKDEAQP